MNYSLTAPKKFTLSATDKFLKDCEFIFTLKGKYKPNVRIILNKISVINMVNVLIIYKAISYSGENRCLIDAKVVTDDYVMHQLMKYGLYPLLISYVSNSVMVESEYKHLEIVEGDKFIIAPQALLRGDSYTDVTIRKKYLPTIENYYRESPKSVAMVLTCLSEILLNFWEHATEDDKTIIMAYGTKDRIEIACADNGQGIITTLTNKTKNKSKRDILLSSIERGVTSKEKSNHMGYGLWLLNEFASKTGGRLHIFSQGGHLQSEHGKIRYHESGNWEGTIVYLDLPLNNSLTISDIVNSSSIKKDSNLKINWA